MMIYSVDGREVAGRVAGRAVGRKKLDIENTRRANETARKYLTILEGGRSDLPLPIVKWKSETGARSLGHNTANMAPFLHWSTAVEYERIGRAARDAAYAKMRERVERYPSKPMKDLLAVIERLERDGTMPPRPTTTTVLERYVADDPRTFERVVAHETVHHFNHVALDSKGVITQLGMLQRGIPIDSHGQDFLDAARKINDAIGDPAFITIKSDQTYVQPTVSKPYYLYARVGRLQGVDRVAFAWAARIGPNARRRIIAEMGRPEMLGHPKLFCVTDPFFHVGPKIEVPQGRTIRVAIPTEPEGIAKLDAIYYGSAGIPPDRVKARTEHLGEGACIWELPPGPPRR